MGGMMGGSGYVGMILNLVITIGVIVGIVLLVAWLIRRVGAEGGAISASQRTAAGQLSPREILQARYARGDITREQYQQILSDLS